LLLIISVLISFLQWLAKCDEDILVQMSRMDLRFTPPVWGPGPGLRSLLQSSTWWTFLREASVKVKVSGILWTQTTCVTWVIFIRIPHTWLHIIQLWKLINGSGYLILISKYFCCNWDYSWEIKWWVIEKRMERRNESITHLLHLDVM
jgi:hypothetical protein